MSNCTVPPDGWICTRGEGHNGPCAARVANKLLGNKKDILDLISEVLNEQLGDSYYCTRDWGAWSVGTMRDSDFFPVTDRTDEIIAEIVRRVNAFNDEER